MTTRADSFGSATAPHPINTGPWGRARYGLVTQPKRSSEPPTAWFARRLPRTGTLGRLGHYEIESVIGRGGCGIVLKAFDETPAGASRTARRAARATMPTPVWRRVD